jgi:hypothetical protein
VRNTPIFSPKTVKNRRKLWSLHRSLAGAIFWAIFNTNLSGHPAPWENHCTMSPTLMVYKKQLVLGNSGLSHYFLLVCRYQFSGDPYPTRMARHCKADMARLTHFILLAVNDLVCKLIQYLPWFPRYFRQFVFSKFSFYIDLWFQ